MNSENNQMDADELANRVNEYLGNLSDADKRFAQLTKRRILDYTTKGLLLKPFKNGNKNYYTDEHFQQLITLRELQSKVGVSEKTLMKAVASTTVSDSTSSDLQSKALNILNSFKDTSSPSMKDETSDRILKNIGSEYIISSSLNPMGAASSLNNEGVMSKSIARALSAPVEQSWQNNVLNNMAYANFSDLLEVKSNNTQRDRQGMIRGALNNDFYSRDRVYEIVPGMKVIVNDGLQLDKEQEEIVREFTNKMIEAYRKVVDGS